MFSGGIKWEHWPEMLFLSKINSFLFVPLTKRCLQMMSLNREKTALNDKCQAEMMLNLNITLSYFLATLTLKS